jgi:hypothetical protein
MRWPEPTGLEGLSAAHARGHGVQFLLHGGRRGAQDLVELTCLATLA